jgi:hypothetical protein
MPNQREQIVEFFKSQGPKGAQLIADVQRAANAADRFRARLHERRRPSLRAFLEVYRRRFGTPSDWLREEITDIEPNMSALLTMVAELVPTNMEFLRVFNGIREVFSETIVIGRRRLLISLLERRFRFWEPVELEIHAADAHHLAEWFERLFDAERLSDVIDSDYISKHGAVARPCQSKAGAAILRRQLLALGCDIDDETKEKMSRAPFEVLEQLAEDLAGVSDPVAAHALIRVRLGSPQG